MTPEAPVICVDGPSGAGKGTLSKRLAEHLGWNLLDSGALYRVVGLACQRAEVCLDDEAGVTLIARQLDVSFKSESEGVSVWLAGEDVSAAVRSEQGGRDASRVAALPEVRAALLYRQQELAVPPGLVADGRDMGTVVFPDAPLKIFLTASPDARAQRRFEQLQGRGESVSLARLLTDIKERDARDQARSVSPLLPASDAVVIDSTQISADDVLHEVLQLLVAKGLDSGIEESRLDPA